MIDHFSSCLMLLLPLPGCITLDLSHNPHYIHISYANFTYISNVFDHMQETQVMRTGLTLPYTNKFNQNPVSLAEKFTLYTHNFTYTINHVLLQTCWY